MISLKRFYPLSMFCAMAFVFCIYAQDEVIQPTRIIDAHSAGMLSRGNFAFSCWSYPNGNTLTSGSGVTLYVTAGLTDRLSIGVGYGGDGIIGREAPHFNPHIGALFKYRIVEESYFVPAIALGYDHQGFGGIDASYNGYIYKSPGFFLALSKNYLLLTKLQVGLHGGLNYSLEDYTDIKWPNGYAGLDVGINEEFSCAMEYDLALNVRDPVSHRSQYANPMYGYLNVGARWFVSRSLCIEFDLKDLLRNKIDGSGNIVGWGRELKLTYIGKIY